MRQIDYIILHCTATSQKATIESIQKYWRETLGWKNPGYHWLITPSGLAFQLQPIDKIANGVKGYNHNSIHISYIGGIDKHGNAVDNRTNEQKQTQIELINRLRKRYPLAKIRGHRDFLKKGTPGWKECPSFDTFEFCRCIGIDHTPDNTNT